MPQSGAFIRETDLECPTHGWDGYPAGTLTAAVTRQLQPCPEHDCGYTVETTAWYGRDPDDNERPAL